MFENMVTSLFVHERIKTTDAKAKDLRPIAERLITLAKHGAKYEAEAKSAQLPEDKQRLMAKAVHKRRLVARVVKDRAVLKKLFEDIQARYADRPGGYTRILKLGRRVGDAAPLSIIELVGVEQEAGAEQAAE